MLQWPFCQAFTILPNDAHVEMNVIVIDKETLPSRSRVQKFDAPPAGAQPVTKMPSAIE